MAHEHRTDKLKRAHHRLVARRLAVDPRLIDQAQDVVRLWAQSPDRPSFVDEWADILRLPMRELRRVITTRGGEWNRLRSSSPFALINTQVIDADGLARLRRKFK